MSQKQTGRTYANRDDGRKVAFEVSGEPARLIVHAVERVSASIDLQRGDGPTERIWSIDQRPRSARKAEYDALFKR